MATPRDPAVTEYVRMRVRDILQRKEMTGDALAKKVGISPSMISSLDKLGVGPRSIDGFAELLFFKDANALREAAYDWWREQNPRTSSRAEEPAVVEAIALVRGLHPAVSDGQIRTILHRFSDPGFDGRDRDYWQRTLFEEIRQDYLRAQTQKAARQDLVRDREREKKRIEGAFRAASTAKKQQTHATAEEPSRDLLDDDVEIPPPAESSHPAVRHSAAVPKKRKRA